jgi:quercetin dioxygenase-like cupin family protein
MPNPLRRSLHALAVCLTLAALTPGRLRAEEPKHAPPTAAASTHVALNPDDVPWQPFPPGGPGAQMAVLSGDLDKPAPFVIRIKMPAGAHVAPHWHPTDEHITVIEGPVGFGMGKKFDRVAGREWPTGSYLLMPKGEPHFAWNRSQSIVQVNGVGPWAVVYVDPADDPRNPAFKPH